MVTVMADKQVNCGLIFIHYHTEHFDSSCFDFFEKVVSDFIPWPDFTCPIWLIVSDSMPPYMENVCHLGTTA